MYFSFKAYRLDLNQTSMQKRLPQHASTLPPRKINRYPMQSTAGIIAKNDATQKLEPWHRAGL